jgi:threonylcarbamoyladenosine tRNA methylthiotransferase MtaB
MKTVANKKKVRVAFHTLGCKLNQAETESLIFKFREDGYQIVSDDDWADVYIVNTCTVTHIADCKSRHVLRAAKRRNPLAIIIATGCYAQRVPQELTPLADFVIGNNEKASLLEIVRGLTIPTDSFKTTDTKSRQKHTDSLRIRSLVKIQAGCYTPCSYCIVPKVRSYEYSVPISLILKEIERKVALGYQEIVITGTKVGCYKDNNSRLSEMIQCILAQTDIQRIRLSSLQPQEITPQLLSLWHDNRLCRHFHLALQSGSDTVLHRMRREYSVNNYEQAVSMIKETIPDVAVTTDVMVGFPGESDEEFEESYLCCEQIGFAGIHVFPFSIRQGTEAAEMPGQTTDMVKSERVHRILKVANCCRRNFYTSFSGRILSVLWERELCPGGGIYSGLTDNYVRVFTRSKDNLANRITLAKLGEFNGKGMLSEIIDETFG